jgi:uncharacterized protein YjbI with pentapeptide repeats/DNA-binding CsgD family transcriptional regulator
MSDEPSEEIKYLQHKITQLEAENEQLKTILKTEGKVGFWLTKIGFRFFLGRNLTHSIGAWRKAAWEQKRIPDQETDELIAAILRRWVLRIGLTALIAVVPTVVTLFLLTQQNTLIRGQIDQQARLNDISRRAQLLATLYDRPDCGAENSEDCPLQASIRARVEAAKAFVEIERIVGNQPDLSQVDLSKGDLHGAVLTGTILSQANLISTTLSSANLFGANLSGAHLDGANLIWAHLFDANLSEADLFAAKLFRADLHEADLLAQLQSQSVALDNMRQILAAFSVYGRESQSPDARQDLTEPLTPRELQTLQLLATDLSVEDIATEMVVSVATVRTHAKHIYSKLTVHSRLQAVQRAKELALL